MSRTDDMMTSSKDTSPDPLTLPSSPLGTRSPRKTRNAATLRSRKVRTSGTPSRSLIIDPAQAGDASPWRIKVTVEAESREGSPSQPRTRTVTIPLRDESSFMSSSPAKRFAEGKEESNVKRPARKRRGTPGRDRKPFEPQPMEEEATDQEISSPEKIVSPARRTSDRIASLTTRTSTTRTRRLIVARNELDQALQAAIGSPVVELTHLAPGDKTISLNEDFSMVSVDSLQGAKDASMANVIQVGPGGNELASHMHSPDRDAQYPETADRHNEMTLNSVRDYDRMSWEASSAVKDVSGIQSSQKRFDQETSNQHEWQRERDAVSRAIQFADAENVIVVDDEGHDYAYDDTNSEDEQVGVVGEYGEEDDIWQDEASRSVEQDQHDKVSPQVEASHSRELQDLLNREPLKPLRPKIPRTWRRSSGIDFTYVDSPAHEPAEQHQQERRHSTDGSGVLTPPSTEDEARAFQADLNGADDDDVESDFEPDAEATRVHDETMAGDRAASSSMVGSEAITPVSESGNDSSGSEGTDTGGFFSSNMPAVFTKQRQRKRPPRQKTMDLTELLNLDGANSPIKAAAPGSHTSHRHTPGKQKSELSSGAKKRSPLHMRPVLGRFTSNPQESGKDDGIASPLRRSLLRSSKMHGSPLKRDEKGALHMPYPQAVAANLVGQGLGNSDQRATQHPELIPRNERQLLREPARRLSKNRDDAVHYDRNDMEGHNGIASHVSSSGQGKPSSHEESLEEVLREHEEYTEETGEQMLQSYEEQLNLDSPQKVTVNFNDSIGSSLLAPKKAYPPLFGSASRPHQAHPAVGHADLVGTVTLVEKRPVDTAVRTVSAAEPSLLSRLSSTFWSAVVRPSGPTEIFSPPVTDASFASELRSQLRCRYGVAPEDFPWTMYHMRILHRMLNSLTSNRNDSIIPRSGPLPAYLSQAVNTRQTSITGYKWLFTARHAYVVWSFFQVLLSADLIAAMQSGEIEWLGDGMAKQCRGYYGRDTRHGSDPVWTKEKLKSVDLMQGKIGLDFIVMALGSAVSSNEALAQREGLPFEELQRLGRV